MSQIYHEGNRRLQDQFDTRRLADKGEQSWVHDEVREADQKFIERADMFFLATADEQGRPNVSYKGGDPGFVKVLDERTIAFPIYDGNGMFVSAGNTLVNPNVGLLFIDFERQRRLRLNGVASIDANDPLMAEYSEALFVVRVRTRQVFPNCPRYIHKYQLVERSQYVPQAACETPIPDWKRNEDYVAVLPANDRARTQ